MQPAVDPLPDAGPSSFSAHLAVSSAGRAKGERTRAQIQIAACGVLDATGPQDLTISAICAAAGLSNGTFYIYFSDRTALLDALLAEFVAFLQTSMRRASARRPDAAPQAATRAYFDLFRDNPGLMRCLIHHLDGFPEAREAFQRLNREWIEAVVASVQRRLRQAGQGDRLSRDELLRRAYALGGMVDQYLSALLLSGDPTLAAVSQDPEQVLDTLSLIWERGMAP